MSDPQLPEPEPLRALIDALRRLPGVGERTARRMAYHLLQHDLAGASQLGVALERASKMLLHCESCNSFSETALCQICASSRRDPSLLCIVETPADQNMVESSHGYRGLYYVLMGRLAPIEGVGPNELQFERLIKRVSDEHVREVILATNFTAEGETTAHYLAEILRNRDIKVTRLARGVPAGSELEYVDASTIAWALQERRDT
ncbi:recombination mediator RecR [Paenalcaligenes niemegkensis]|uniref:recombination mediator RecR n=1 Tax=Paenalcaligenes niemegkensis TaxID=2895469 RepID=UPI001EE94B55|nr:recombination mediator RecR [Paenalcaligenes niemegkensis]MCQ9615820.1 recombination mediator RecR [Paenalcaligenes niemegkensis]